MLKPSAQKVLAALARGEKLTQLVSIRTLGVAALGQRCTELRQMGFPITSKRVPGKSYNVYYWSES